ncbi:MAG: hypothetical protein SOZ27_06075 [Spirochaetia bacterium]|nr:hypothetical protein [Spirochaetia bacterium]
MKKIKMLGLLLFVLTGVGCMTTPQISQPVFPIGIRYEVLGRVTIGGGSKQNGYIKLIEEAEKKYPESDDVVNIQVDRTRDGKRFALTGIAVKYLK